MIQHIIQIAGVREEDIVLDFFAGSCATAEAVINANIRDGGRRKFIMVQIPESCPPKSDARAAGFEDIAELGRERIRRIGSKVTGQPDLVRENLDVGFRTLRVDTTNMSDVLRQPDETGQDSLSNFENSVKPGRTGEDLLFQVLLDWGLEVGVPISVERAVGKDVFVVDEGALVACFDGDVTPDLVRALAGLQPLRAVFRDSGFASDDDRINAEQIFKELSPTTDVKAI